MSLHIIILAAGKGTRMKSNTPKVLHRLGNKPLLAHVIETAQELEPEKIHIVYGEDGELVRTNINYPQLHWVLQKERLGTGHAVMQVLPYLEGATQVLILYGDVPLITPQTLQQFITQSPVDGLGLLSTEVIDPMGFGRIVRDNAGQVIGIVEQRDASAEQQQIKEINSGIFVTSSKLLGQYLPLVQQNNAQREYYLTDILSLFHVKNLPIYCMLLRQPEEISGVNNQQQLARAERIYQRRLVELLMLNGVTVMDPARLDIRGKLTTSDNVVIDINVIIEGEVTVGANTTIGPHTILKNVTLGKNVVIQAHCFLEGATIADNCVVGPFARIRPHTSLARGAQVGNFIEVKNTTLGANTKAHHVSYLGDAKIGNNVNIGAGTITCNYDGVKKYATNIDDGVFVGSNTSLVAPVSLGAGAVIGAGSVITHNAPPAKLTLARAEQTTIEHWQRKKKEP